MEELDGPVLAPAAFDAHFRARAGSTLLPELWARAWGRTIRPRWSRSAPAPGRCSRRWSALYGFRLARRSSISAVDAAAQACGWPVP